jgi:hypothetical protein
MSLVTVAETGVIAIPHSLAEEIDLDGSGKLKRRRRAARLAYSGAHDRER